jgi:hypothetical protein
MKLLQRINHNPIFIGFWGKGKEKTFNQYQYFSDKPNNLSFGLGKAYWVWGKGKLKPFPFPLSPLTEKYCNQYPLRQTRFRVKNA